MSARSDAPAAWSALLADAVARPGVLSEAYNRFWNYSVGNQLLAMWQCAFRRLEPGPINTFVGWQELGRHVKKGERALTLCMPISIKRRDRRQSDEKAAGNDDPQSLSEDHRVKEDDPGPRRAKIFTFRAHWFVLAQTDGEPYKPQELPTWSEATALSTLSISRIPFTILDGNAQGFATGRCVSVSPLAYAPHRTLMHELGHVVLGHTAESQMVDDDRTPRNIQEVEAEGVALICCESLGLPGGDHSRGYLQHWLRGEKISDQSARRIFTAADSILRAGRAAALEPVQ